MAVIGITIRVGLIAVFTGIETAALAGWLELVHGESGLSASFTIGIAVLLVGLVAEHILTDISVNGLTLNFPIRGIVAISLSETILWALWLEIAQAGGGIDGFVMAFAVFAILLVPQHTIEDNTLKGKIFSITLSILTPSDLALSSRLVPQCGFSLCSGQLSFERPPLMSK
jgi:hypothetical protein